MHPAFEVSSVDGVVFADLDPISALRADADWSAREVAAAEFRTWLLEHAQACRIVVQGACVLHGDNEASAPVDLTDRRMEAAIVLRDCRVDPALVLDDATVGRLEFDGCDLRGGVRLANARVRGGLLVTGGTRLGSDEEISVDGSNATMDGNVRVVGARLGGALRLRGATIGGQLVIRGGAQVTADSSGQAVDADGLKVARVLYVEGKGTRLEGALRLVGATVSGQLGILEGAQVAAGPNGQAVEADGLNVAQGLLVHGQGTRLEGALRLVGATIGGTLAIVEGAQVAAGPNGQAVEADGLNVTQDLLVHGQGTRLEGALRLGGASVGGTLAIVEGAQVGADPNGQAVDADGLNVTQSVLVHGQGTRLEGALRLGGATIGGQLAIHGGAQVAADPTSGRAVDANGLNVAQGLFVDGQGTRLKGALRLGGASVGATLAIHSGAQVAADPTSGRAVDANGLNVAQGLFVHGQGTRLEGALRLGGATIGGQLTIYDEAQVGADSSGQAIDADGLNVVQDLFVRGEGTRLEGALRLVGASVGGTLEIRAGAQVAADATNGRAVDADRLNVAQGLFVRGENTRLEGALRLVGARVGGQLAIHGGAQVAGDPTSGCAVDADGVNVAQGLFVRGENTRLEGALRLVGARVGGTLAIHHGAQVAGDVDLQAGEVSILAVTSGVIDGVFDLSHARIGRLDDAPSGWQQVAGGWRLAGISIKALSGALHDPTSWTVRQRIRWLNDDQPPSRRPFSEVAELYRQAGHRDEARKIAIAGEKATSRLWRRWWAGVTIGYGYQPWRAAVIALVLIGLAWLATSAVGGDELFVPTSAHTVEGCPDDYPCLNRALLLTETVVPVVDFGQRDAWRIDPRTRYSAPLQAGQFLLDALGWLLALLLLGAVSGVVRRD